MASPAGQCAAVIIRQDLFKLSVIAEARTSQVGHFTVRLGQSRSRQGFRGLEEVVGAILRGRAMLRAASALQQSIRADEWAIQPRGDFQA